MVTKIIVPRVGAPGPTEQALQAQGTEYQAREVDAGAAYSVLVANLWREREAFLLIEHDVVPPSEKSIIDLCACPEPWCTVAYPGPQLFMALGVLKMSTDALEVSQDLPALWEGEPWGTLDSKVIPALHSRFPLHGHWPPFRHTRFE